MNRNGGQYLRHDPITARVLEQMGAKGVRDI